MSASTISKARYSSYRSTQCLGLTSLWHALGFSSNNTQRSALQQYRLVLGEDFSRIRKTVLYILKWIPHSELLVVRQK